MSTTPRLVSGIWTPRAEVLCYPCHGPTIEGRAIPSDQWTWATTRHAAEGRETFAVCDRCAASVWLTRDDVARLQALIHAADKDEDGPATSARLEQTGGMCCAARFDLPGDAFVIVTDSETGTEETLYAGLYVNQAAFENGDEGAADILEAPASDILGFIRKAYAAAMAKGPHIVSARVEEIPGPGIPLFRVVLLFGGLVLHHRALKSRHEAAALAERFNGTDTRRTSLLLTDGRWTAQPTRPL